MSNISIQVISNIFILLTNIDCLRDIDSFNNKYSKRIAINNKYSKRKDERVSAKDDAGMIRR